MIDLPSMLKFLLEFIIGGQEYRSSYLIKRELLMKKAGKTPEFHSQE